MHITINQIESKSINKYKCIVYTKALKIFCKHEDEIVLELNIFSFSFHKSMLKICYKNIDTLHIYLRKLHYINCLFI